jgi:hypothetical protein
MLPGCDLLPHLTCSHRRASVGAEMGQISMATRDELVVALAGRYAASNRKERGRVLDEFAAVSGLHRKHAMRLLRAGQLGRRSGPDLRGDYTRPARHPVARRPDIQAHSQFGLRYRAFYREQGTTQTFEKARLPGSRLRKCDMRATMTLCEKR